MNNSVFGKTMENHRKHRDINFVTIERRRNYLLSEPDYYTTKFFTENLLAIEIGKAQIHTNKIFQLGLTTLGLSKTAMFGFWYGYVKPKYGEKAKLCCIDTESSIVYIKVDDVYKDTAEDI